ncbi:MAG: ADP-ribosyltransferase [Bacteroidota bacterium]
MPPANVKKYVEKYLTSELRAIVGSDRAHEFPELSNYEKAVIYKYTNDGYESLNDRLRKSKGSDVPLFGKHLEKALRKLTNYEGVVFRGVHLSETNINQYRKALSTGHLLTEYPFLSTSTSFSIANNVPGLNCIFVIASKTGKAIEKIAKFGIHNPPNEREVLFMPNTQVRVLSISGEGGYTTINIEEV